jgi:hypothetical protein
MWMNEWRVSMLVEQRVDVNEERVCMLVEQRVVHVMGRRDNGR